MDDSFRTCYLADIQALMQGIEAKEASGAKEKTLEVYESFKAKIGRLPGMIGGEVATGLDVPFELGKRGMVRGVGGFVGGGGLWKGGRGSVRRGGLSGLGERGWWD